MGDGYEVGITIGLIFLASGIGSYLGSAAIGCAIFGGGVIILGLFSGMLKYLDNKK